MHHFLAFLNDALHNQQDWVCFYVFLFLACVAPRLGDRVFAPIERVGSRFALKKGLAIFSISIAAILIRLAFLRIDPVPVPLIHDEFSYLLAGDTFAHWRLTNPTHPMWIFFETFHVLQHPTYASKYPPAQGMVLALGQHLGNPWVGVLLSVGVMCGAILWMLQGWMPARWALLGGILLLLRFAVFNDWVEDYWGGAVAAIGGALVVGALPRIWRAARPRYALCMGIGAAILANSRPVEGFIFFATVVAALAIWLWNKPAAQRARLFAAIVLPIAAVLLICVVFMGYYNWRVTRNPLLPPYLAYERAYNPRPEFVWQSPKPSPVYDNPQFDNYYNVWAPSMFGGGWDDIEAGTWETLKEFFNFFVNKELGLCLLGLPWLWRDRRVRFLEAQFAICLAGLLAVVWFWPHYAAPLLATLFAILVQCLRHVRQLRVRGWAVGIGLSRAVVLISLGSLVAAALNATPIPYETNANSQPRYLVESKLAFMPGRQLVIVRYSAQHDPGDEWVYNRADIDDAKIVWAREIPGVNMQPLFDYFRGRSVWLVQPDIAPTPLTSYSPPTPPASRLNSPALRNAPGAAAVGAGNAP
jgi:hypothetical protein